jgi:flagellin
MQQANRNVQQGNNMMQTAAGGLNEISNILGRMRELAVHSASDGVNGDDRSSIDLEFQQLKAEITRIADATEYNNTKLINGSRTAAANSTTSTATFGTGAGQVNKVDVKQDDSAVAGTYTISFSTSGDKITLTHSEDATITKEIDTSITPNEPGTWDFDTDLGLKVDHGGFANAAAAQTALDGKTLVIEAGAMIQVGSNNTLDDRISFNLGDHRDTGLSIDDDDLTSLGNAQTAINALDDAIKLVNDERGNIGAKQNRLEFTSSNLMNSIQNNSASMSTIRDADFAVEAADLARNQILTQSGSAMLAQANSLSQNVLGLIR